MKKHIKKHIVAILTGMVLVVALSTSVPKADAQVYCGSCCGWVNGQAVIGCGLVTAAPCGNPCWCNNVPGQGFCC